MDDNTPGHHRNCFECSLGRLQERTHSFIHLGRETAWTLNLRRYCVFPIRICLEMPIAEFKAL